MDTVNIFTAENPARVDVAQFSSSREPAVSVYPDSDKIGVYPGDEGWNTAG